MIYVANRATLGELEAEQDDPSTDLESLATPRLVGVSTAMTTAWVDLMKEGLLNEVLGELGEDLSELEVLGKLDEDLNELEILDELHEDLSEIAVRHNDLGGFDDGLEELRSRLTWRTTGWSATDASQAWDLMDGDRVVGRLVILWFTRG